MGLLSVRNGLTDSRYLDCGVFSYEGSSAFGDYCVGWMGRAEGTSQVLSAQEIQAVFDWKNPGFRVQVC